MIRYLQHGDIDRAWWNERIRCAREPLWYALAEVLDAAAPGWEALVHEGSGTVMPLAPRRKWGFRYLFQPFAVQRLGLFGPAPDARQVGAFLSAVPEHFRLWDIHLNDAASMGQPADVVLTQRTTMELVLDGDVGKVRSAYGQSHRRGLRKWAGDGEVCALSAEELLAVMQAAPQLRRWQVNAGQFDTLRRLLQVADMRGELRCLGLRRGGTWGAVGCFVTWQGRTIFLKGLSTEAGRGVFALHRVMDAAIAAVAPDSHVLDMAGGHDPELRRFYAGFGARPRLYLHAKVNRLPQPLRWYKQRSDGL